MPEANTKKKRDSRTYIFLPGEAIKSLRLELSNLLGEKLAAGALFRFGFRCGETLMERSESNVDMEKGMENSLPGIWEQTGLGKITSIQEISEEEIEIEQKESTEAKAMGNAGEPSCDYTRGYLAGIATMLTKKKFYCVETACISEGKEGCNFHLVVFPHKVYVSKKKS
ncbi:MAG: 4-vinyl reductase [Thermoplasmata archaeon]|nr:MAG: 4-vinyl reductase [Thermoplasmata archaeon]